MQGGPCRVIPTKQPSWVASSRGLLLAAAALTAALAADAWGTYGGRAGNPRDWHDVDRDTFDYLYNNEPTSYLNITVNCHFGAAR